MPRKYTRKAPLPAHMRPTGVNNKNPGWSIPVELADAIKAEADRRNAQLKGYEPQWTASAVAAELITKGMEA